MSRLPVLFYKCSVLGFVCGKWVSLVHRSLLLFGALRCWHFRFSLDFISLTLMRASRMLRRLRFIGVIFLFLLSSWVLMGINGICIAFKVKMA